MNIKTYISSRKMTQAQFGSLVGVSQALVSLWLSGKKQIDVEYAISIEAKTRKQVRRHELRPDIWPAPVRRSRKTTEA